MKRAEVVFLLSVFGFASVFSLMSVSQAIRLAPAGSAAEVAAPGAAGQARDVDMEKLQQLLRQGRLSKHEAEFYKEFTVSPGPVEDTRTVTD